MTTGEAGLDPAMADPSDDVVETDGRVARGSRNRDAIVDSIIELNLEGELQPSVAQVAERAGVSERSVFRHFEDMARLHQAAATRHLQRIAPIIVDVAPEGPLEARIAAFVAHRARLLEANSPIRRATNLREPFYPELREILDRGRRALRKQVRTTFGPELASMDPVRARLVLEALDMATSWDAWELLRAFQGLDEESAAAVMSETLTALLG